MPGRIIDLAHSGEEIVGPVVLDSNIVIARWLALYEPAHSRNVDRAAALFRQLHSTGTRTLLTPTGYKEVLHSAIRTVYRESHGAYRSTLQSHYGREGGFSWLDLYKLSPAILQQQSALLHTLRTYLQLERVSVLDPGDLGTNPQSKLFEEELLDLVVRFGLDSSDAMILLEAARVDVPRIVSLDPDMTRAAAEFDVYTWLDPD